jgi:hypothetical protein
MALSRGALDELRRELAAVRRSRATIDARIQGLELILAAERSSAAEGVESSRRSARIRIPSPSKGRPVGRRREKGSFRKMVLDALQKAPGSKCADLARLIEDEGVRIDGATSLRDRISHEIYRLRRLGAVRKDRGGLYVVQATQQDSVSRVPDMAHDSASGAVSAST